VRLGSSVLDGREQQTLSRLLQKLREGDIVKFVREILRSFQVASVFSDIEFLSFRAAPSLAFQPGNAVLRQVLNAGRAANARICESQPNNQAPLEARVT
jgi:hypothetical protein